MSNTTETQKQQETQEQIEAGNRAVVMRWTRELWGAGKLEVADEIVAPRYVRHDPGDPFAVEGPAEVKRLVTMLRGMLPDLKLEIDDMIASGDKVISRYVGTATDTRGYLGRPPTGRTIRTTAIQIFRFEEGRIAESWAVRDDLGTLVQLGHLPAPGTPGRAAGSERAEPGMRIGHVNLRVAELPRAIAFYRDVLGFEVTGDASAAGIPMALLAAGDYHHHIALNTFRSAGGTPPPAGHTGLHHVAILYPGRQQLAQAVERILGRGYPIDGAEDHGATISVYLRDPDGNGLELYYDQPREMWRGVDGAPVMRADPFDPRALVAEAAA
jgi:catechol 2,3-dioxygenase